MAAPDFLPWRQGIVLGSALVYWGGVWVQARRIRRKIGRSANLRPRGLKERLLWLGWTTVVCGWLILPWVAGSVVSPWLPFARWLNGVPGFASGTALVWAGYAGTLWCYAAMGSAWRIGINRQERNALVRTGPYRWVRHPIYLFQIIMLLGAAALLPALLALLLLVLHFGCAWTKARDEEAYLLEVHGEDYQRYCEGTGRFLPIPRVSPRI